MPIDLATNLVSAINMQPALIAPEAQFQLSSMVQQLAAANIDTEEQSALSRRDEMLAAYGLVREEQTVSKPFAFAQGMAIIPIHGMLINRFGRSWGWVTGYNFIRSQMDAAEADPDVKGIIFDVNSYGGMVAGCFELAADMAALTKPTLSVVDHASYSAGFALGSAANKIVATQSSGVGSVGVIGIHFSMEKALEKYGYEVTIISSGDHKADGNPYEKLPESVRKSMQKSMDATRDEFVNLVATNRGIEPKVVSETEAQSYRAKEALDIGFIDAITSPQKAVTAFFNELSGSQTQETIMSATQNQAGAESQATTVTADQARIEERQRMSAILGSEEAASRPKLANHLALNTSMSADEAKAMLAVAAKETVEVAATVVTTTTTTANASTEPNPLDAAMQKNGSPKVGADSNSDADATTPEAQGQAIIASFALATGAKFN